MLSSRLYSTAPSRGFCASSFASAQGMVSSIYLLLLLAREMMASRVSAIRYSFMSRSTSATVFSAVARRSSSTASVLSAGWITPPKYFCAMAMVRFTRFPRVLARSVLYRSIRDS